MINLKSRSLNKKLKKIEKENLPTKKAIEKENKSLLKEEKAFERKFRLKIKNGKTKKAVK